MPQWRASLGSSNRQAPSDAEAMQKAPVAVHHRSACSGVKALRNTSVAKRQAAKLWLAFRSLDLFRALREPDRRRRDEKRPCRSEQKTATNQNDYLTGKAPYKSCKLHFASPALVTSDSGRAGGPKRDLLAPVYGWFTEGFDTPDLRRRRRMKGALARLGIRNFRPTLRNAAEHLAGLYTPEGSPLPPNVAAELERD